MTIDSKPDGDDMRQFVCSGVNFDIDDTSDSPKRRSKLEGAEPRVGLGSLRARADAESTPTKRKRRRVKKKDVTNMNSLYSYEPDEESGGEESEHELTCLHCHEPHDVAHVLERLDHYIEQIVSRRLEEREGELRQELVREFQRRRMASE